MEERLDYFGLSAYMGRNRFELRQNGTVLESIKIPEKVRKFYHQLPYRRLMVLDYMDRKLGNEIQDQKLNDSDFLKKLAVSLNRILDGILLLENLDDTSIVLSGIGLDVSDLNDQKFLLVSAGGTRRYFPFDLEVATKLLHPVLLAAGLRKGLDSSCCGGKKKSR